MGRCWSEYKIEEGEEGEGEGEKEEGGEGGGEEKEERGKRRRKRNTNWQHFFVHWVSEKGGSDHGQAGILPMSKSWDNLKLKEHF